MAHFIRNLKFPRCNHVESPGGAICKTPPPFASMKTEYFLLAYCMLSQVVCLVSINYRLLELGEQNLKLGYLGVFAEIIEQARLSP